MSIQKRYLKTKPVCKVTFKITEQQADSVTRAHVVGAFNNWSTTATPMKRLKDGSFSATVELKTGRSYHFRYFLGQSIWKNDPDADDDARTHYGDSYNSVINL